MDLRFCLVELPVIDLIMDYQRNGWRKLAEEGAALWPIDASTTCEQPQARPVVQVPCGVRAFLHMRTNSRRWNRRHLA
jgi:hypothetical protein